MGSDEVGRCSPRPSRRTQGSLSPFSSCAGGALQRAGAPGLSIRAHPVLAVVPFRCDGDLSQVADTIEEQQLPSARKTIRAFVHRQHGPARRMYELRANPIHRGVVLFEPHHLRQLRTSRCLFAVAFSAFICVCIRFSTSSSATVEAFASK